MGAALYRLTPVVACLNDASGSAPAFEPAITEARTRGSGHRGQSNGHGVQPPERGMRRHAGHSGGSGNGFLNQL